MEGGTDRSYGIQVARLAGVPAAVVERAKDILRDIEQDAGELAPRIAKEGETRASGRGQLGLFDPSPAAPAPVEAALRAIDVESTTPLQALAELQRLKDLLD